MQARAYLSCFLVARKPTSNLKVGGAHLKPRTLRMCVLARHYGITQKNSYCPRPSSVEPGASGDES